MSMDVRTFRANNLQEALQLVRQALGDDASVLQTREFAPSLWAKFVGRTAVEVVATTNFRVPSRFDAQGFDFSSPNPSAPQSRHSDSRSLYSHSEMPPSRLTFDQPLNNFAGGRSLEDPCSLDSVAPRLAWRDQHSRTSDPHIELFAELCEAGVEDAVAHDLIEKLRLASQDVLPWTPIMARRLLAKIIAQGIRTCGPISVVRGERRIAALVGPTGVGKTTTIAKLAAQYHLREQKRVGLITVDTYRVAAVDQLRAYADIINLPMLVVASAKEMREAVNKLSDCDLILIDTAGRSPKDQIKIQELRAMLREASPDDILLVLSAVSSASVLMQTAERFVPVGPTSVVYTKLDEALGLGHLIPVFQTSGFPTSYLTNGQNVPDDILTPNAEQMARMILSLEN